MALHIILHCGVPSPPKCLSAMHVVGHKGKITSSWSHARQHTHTHSLANMRTPHTIHTHSAILHTKDMHHAQYMHVWCVPVKVIVKYEWLCPVFGEVAFGVGGLWCIHNSSNNNNKNNTVNNTNNKHLFTYLHGDSYFCTMTLRDYLWMRPASIVYARERFYVWGCVCVFIRDFGKTDKIHAIRSACVCVC